MKKTHYLAIVLVILILIIGGLFLITPKAEIQEVDFPETTYLGVKEEITFDQMRDAETYGAAYGKVMEYITTNDIIPSGPPVNIYFTWDDEAELTTMGIGMPVTDITEIDSEDLELMVVGPSKALKAVHKGAYMKLFMTHNQLMKHQGANEYEFNDLTIEEYVTEADAKPLLTNVYMLVK
jgi:effector-binding domain-containing protein